jgi:ubiquinone/menaquinone biosynthesis C-methylase UbiE
MKGVSPHGQHINLPPLALPCVCHTLQVYDVIASHFSSTRFAVWPKVRAFLDSLPPGSVVADLGCGNGKYLGVRKDLAVLGCDRSAGECCPGLGA